MHTSSKAVGPQSVLTPEEFRAVLLRERALSDRSGLPFAVLAFGVGREDEAAARERLLDALAGRLRETDLLGWLEGELAALLRYASVAEALRVAVEVRALLAPDAPPCRAFGHPPFEFERSVAAPPARAEPALQVDTAASALPVAGPARPVVERGIGASAST